VEDVATLDSCQANEHVGSHNAIGVGAHYGSKINKQKKHIQIKA
jgi:hypothetical protein